MITIDGSLGEGGGQILRSALSLAMITGQAFHLKNIRAGRSKPGLLRQHLTAVQAASEVCQATTQGAQLNATELRFTPGPLQSGDYRYDIGSAGSCGLVLQTVVPALWFADRASSVTVSGGTHNRAAPPADFLMLSWQPIMNAIGLPVRIELTRHGFYPAGGGLLCAHTAPRQSSQPLQLETRGKAGDYRATAIIAGLTSSIAERELTRLAKRFTAANLSTQIRHLPAQEGPGNALLLQLQHAKVCTVFSEFGEKGISAEQLADTLAHTAHHYLQSQAAVDEHLADQLLLPMALGQGGSFTTPKISEHTRSNLKVLQQFLPQLRYEIEEQGQDCYRVSLST